MNTNPLCRLASSSFLCCLALLGILLPSTVMAYSEQRQNHNIIWQASPNQYLAVVTDTTELAQLTFAHPIQLTPETINYYLTHVQMRRSSSSKPTAVLAEYELNTLALEMSKALSSLEPNQYLRFVIKRVKRGFAGFGDTDLFTAGSIGVVNGEVFIAFGDINRQRDYGYEAIHNSNSNRPVTYTFDHGGFNPSHTTGQLLSVQGQQSYRDQNQQNTGFVRFPTGTVSLPAPPPQPTLVTKAPAAPVSEADSVSKSLPTPQTVSLPAPQPEQASPVQSSTNSHNEKLTAVSAPTQVNPQDALGKSVEDKLRLLKRLYEQDLITAEEYAQSKARLLSDL